MGDVRHEPSMEDILASIKRIIADDGSAAPPGPRVRAARPVAVPSPANHPEDTPSEGVGEPPQAREVLELTDEVPLPARTAEPLPEEAGAFPAEQAPEPVARSAPESPVTSEPPVPPEPSVLPESPSPAATDADDGAPAPLRSPTLLSDAAAEASRHAFAALSAMVVQPEPGAAANTLEGLVREMLRPILKDWLDANLPALVETLVAKEIARISGRP